MSLDGFSDGFGRFQSLLARANHIGHVFFASVAGRQIGFSYHVANYVSDITNCVASYQVPAPVVDPFEKIYVHHNHAYPLWRGFLSDPAYLALKLGKQASP